MRSRGGAYRKQQIVRKSRRLSIQTSNNQIIIPKSTFRVVKEQARHSTNQWHTQPINEETRDRQEVGKVVDVYATKSWLREQAHKPSPRVPPATLRLATSTIPGACTIMRSFWELLLLVSKRGTCLVEFYTAISHATEKFQNHDDITYVG